VSSYTITITPDGGAGAITVHIDPGAPAERIAELLRAGAQGIGAAELDQLIQAVVPLPEPSHKPA
jgi:hypothetical protein